MKISFHTLGDVAMLVNFEQKIDIAINEQVHSLAHSIEIANLPFINYVTPAYCSLTIAFDKTQISYKDLKIIILDLEGKSPSLKALARKLYIPVCYDRSFGLDLDEISGQTSLTTSELVELHTSIEFRVYMIGFLPGFPYLGKLPKEMSCSRKPNPRLKVAKGSVGLAGLQTGIYPESSPGGWQIVGRTPVDLKSNNRTNPFLFLPGDIVQFYSISKSKYNSILEEQNKGNFSWNNIYE